MPAVSSSPVEAVTEDAEGVHRSRCSDCSAQQDNLDADVAWMWLETHLCGTETLHLPDGDPQLRSHDAAAAR